MHVPGLIVNDSLVHVVPVGGKCLCNMHQNAITVRWIKCENPKWCQSCTVWINSRYRM